MFRIIGWIAAIVVAIGFGSTLANSHGNFVGFVAGVVSWAVLSAILGFVGLLVDAFIGNVADEVSMAKRYGKSKTGDYKPYAGTTSDAWASTLERYGRKETDPLHKDSLEESPKSRAQTAPNWDARVRNARRLPPPE